jgi:A1 cistron-splicing factor AAR2
MEEQEQARRRLLEGGFLICLDVPAGGGVGVGVGIGIGIDCKMYRVGPQFKGIKMIPPGLHLVVSSASEDAEDKQGIWFKVSQGSVEVLRWDPAAEDLGPAQLPEASLVSLRKAALGMQLDGNLGPYPEDQWSTWRNLSAYISEKVLCHCDMPLGAKIVPGAEPDPELDLLLAVDSNPSEAEDAAGRRRRGQKQRQPDGAGSDSAIVSYFSGLGHAPRFTDVGSPDGVTPEERTRAYMDRTEQVKALLLKPEFEGSWQLLIGQQQASFVCFLLLASPLGYRQWQRLTALLCSCDSLLKEMPDLFVAFSRALHAQLKLLPEDFFAADLSRENFLVPSLSALFESALSDSTMPQAVVSGVRKLMNFTREHFELSLGPDAPITGSLEGLSGMEWAVDPSDGPAVVPYSEVVRVLGGDEAAAAAVDLVAPRCHEREGQPCTQAPPIDRRKVDAAWASMDLAMGTGPSFMEGLRQRYPQLFAHIRVDAGEDVVMAAARLVGQEGCGTSSEVRVEAAKFLEAEAASESSPLWDELALIGQAQHGHVRGAVKERGRNHLEECA